MSEEKEKGFEHILRRKKLRENVTVVGLRESEKLIGQLYPVLTDEEGNVLDGQHRLKANPNWRREIVKGVDSERKRAMIRLHANWHRRRTQPDQVLEEIAKITEWKGAAPYAAFLGCSVRTIQRYLPQRYKARQRTPKRQLSLSEKSDMTSYEVELRKKRSKEESKLLRPYLWKRQKRVEPSIEWPKERLLRSLGNRLYNTVTLRTEPPEELLNEPQVKEECEFYLEELKSLKTPEKEILNYLSDYREKQIKGFEETKRRREREKAYPDKIDELYNKFVQIVVEFSDGQKLPLNILRLPHENLLDGNRTIRYRDKKYLELYIKRKILPAIATELLGFDWHGYLTTEEEG